MNGEPIYKCPECGYKGLCAFRDDGVGYTEAFGIPDNDVVWVPICPECRIRLSDKDKTGEYGSLY